MSRSRKKVAIVKDNSTGYKKIGNRKFRRKTKNKLHNVDEDTIFPEDKSEVTNDYDVCDYKWFTDNEIDKRK
jgi:hypothetical protein